MQWIQEIKNIQIFDIDYFLSKSYFQDDRVQNYLLLQQVHKCFKTITNSEQIIVWKSKGFSEEGIKAFQKIPYICANGTF